LLGNDHLKFGGGAKQKSDYLIFFIDWLIYWLVLNTNPSNISAITWCEQITNFYFLFSFLKFYQILVENCKGSQLNFTDLLHICDSFLLIVREWPFKIWWWWGHFFQIFCRQATVKNIIYWLVLNTNPSNISAITWCEQITNFYFLFSFLKFYQILVENCKDLFFLCIFQVKIFFTGLREKKFNCQFLLECFWISVSKISKLI
jgi:hypothetical protein